MMRRESPGKYPNRALVGLNIFNYPTKLNTNHNVLARDLSTVLYIDRKPDS